MRRIYVKYAVNMLAEFGKIDWDYRSISVSVDSVSDDEEELVEEIKDAITRIEGLSSSKIRIISMSE